MCVFAAVICGLLAGAIGGALVYLFLSRRFHRLRAESEPAVIGAELNAEIERAASAWAKARGRPEAAGIAADKMRLLHTVARRRGWRQ